MLRSFAYLIAVPSMPVLWKVPGSLNILQLLREYQIIVSWNDITGLELKYHSVRCKIKTGFISFHYYHMPLSSTSVYSKTRL